MKNNRKPEPEIQKVVEVAEPITTEEQLPAALPQSRQPAALQEEKDGPEQQIRELAYQLYEQRGRADGYDVEDWMEAEAIIRQRGKAAA